MTALEGDSVDNPDISLVSERIDHRIRDFAVLPWTVDGLYLRLSGDCLAELIAALHAALEPFSRCGSNRFGDCLVVKMIFP